MNKSRGNGSGKQPDDGTQIIPVNFYLPEIGCPSDIKEKVTGKIADVVGGNGEAVSAFLHVAPTVRAAINNLLYTLGVVAEFRKDEIAIVKAPSDNEGEYYDSYCSA